MVAVTMQISCGDSSAAENLIRVSIYKLMESLFVN